MRIRHLLMLVLFSVLSVSALAATSCYLSVEDEKWDVIMELQAKGLQAPCPW